MAILSLIGRVCRTVFVTVFFCVWAAGVTFATIGLDVGMVGGWVKQLIVSRGPTVQAIIVESRIEHRISDKGYASDEPRLRYQYTIDGHTYESTRLRLDNDADDEKTFVSTHAVGSHVVVHYIASCPALSALDPQVNGWNLNVLLIL